MNKIEKVVKLEKEEIISKLNEERIDYSIGIITYDKRYDHFKSLIKSLPKDKEIIVCVNNNYDRSFNKEYKKDFLNFIANYDNIFPTIFTEYRSLSKLWNNCLINSSNEYMLLLHDDLIIKKGFFRDLDELIKKNKYKSFRLNNSWSHIFLNKNEIAELGWFDERFLSIGWEDTDMEIRYLKKYHKNLPTENIRNITHIGEKKDMLIKQKKVGRYSLFNRKFFLDKYDTNKIQISDFKNKINDIKQYPYEKFYFKNKNKL